MIDDQLKRHAGSNAQRYDRAYFAFDSTDTADFEGSRGRLNVCIPRTRGDSSVRDRNWAHIVESQPPLVAAIELFFGGADVPLGLLCPSSVCMHASLRTALAAARGVSTGVEQRPMPEVMSRLYPVERGSAGDADVATAESVIGK